MPFFDDCSAADALVGDAGSMTKTYSFKRRPEARHITDVTFEGTSARAAIFSPERGLLGTPEYRVRFYDRLGDPTGDRHTFTRYAEARAFVLECFIEGLIR
jgi:hypothetical protein